MPMLNPFYIYIGYYMKLLVDAYGSGFFLVGCAYCFLAGCLYMSSRKVSILFKIFIDLKSVNPVNLFKL